MSHTSKFKKWYKERCGHPLGVNLGMKAVNELTEENAKLWEALEQSSEILRRQLSQYYYKDEVSMLNQYESNKQLLNQLKEQNNDNV